MSDSAHIAALKKQDRLNRLSAARRFRVAGGKFEKYAASGPAEDIETVVATAEEREKHFNLRIGHKDERGIFLGTWTPTDRDGNSLSRTFNVFAAPEDLPRWMDYPDAVKHIAGLTDWHGHHGENYADDYELYEALRKGNYNGGWFIPPRELLGGTAANEAIVYDAGRKVVQPDNLYDHRDKGAFSGTFTRAVDYSVSPQLPEWYWSSTVNPDKPSHVYNVRFSDGSEDWDQKDIYHISCRPVRLELKP